MRFIHLADLHIGKTLNGYSMIEDQEYALNQIVELLKRENIKILLISGDIYQNIIPSTEAIKVFDNFLKKLKELNVKTFIISGNHDSSDRLSFGNSFLKDSNIFISSSYSGCVEKYTLKDDYGNVNFYLLPYIKPNTVKQYFIEKNILSYEDAIKNVLDSINLNLDERNVILSHQYILNASLSDSEEIYLGEDEAVSANLYKDFDYIALGHIHKKQYFLGGKLRYPGALLKYSSKEAKYKKSITIVELKEKGNLDIQEKEIKYLRDVRIIKGYFDDILINSSKDKSKKDYIYVELLDDNDIYEALSELKRVYPNILSLKYVNKNSDLNNEVLIDTDIDMKTPLELFEEFYKNRKNIELSDEKRKIISEIIDEVWGNNENN